MNAPVVRRAIPADGPDVRRFVFQTLREYGIEVDLEVCRYYDMLYAMRSTAFWLSASGLFAEGRNKDLRLARTTYSVPVVLNMAAKALGF